MPQEVTIRHTASAGILFYIGRNTKRDYEEGTALGIDIFAKDPAGLYPDTAEEEKELLFSLIEKRALQTLVFTHAHGDHFCLEDVLEALARNPALHIITTEEAALQIRSSTNQGRLTVVSSGETGNIAVLTDSRSQTALTVFNSPHMGEQYTDVQNLVCLLKIQNKKILIPGDARPDARLYERAAAWSSHLDWLIGPFPLIGLPTARRVLTRFLTVSHILAVHLPRPGKDPGGWRASAESVCARTQDGLPEPIFGDTIGEEYRL